MGYTYNLLFLIIYLIKKPIKTNTKKKINNHDAASPFTFSYSHEENTTDKITGEATLKSIYDFDNYGVSHNLAMDHIATMPNFNVATLEDIFHFADSYTNHTIVILVNVKIGKHTKSKWI